MMEWEFFEYNLDAGEHKLEWEFISNYTGPSDVWLDNIFFPANSVVTGVNQDEQVPSTFNLHQNYPNPFNPNTTISWELPVGSHISLKVYDVLGNEVATLVNEQRTAGRYEINFDASALSSGVYFYQLKTNEFVATKKLMVIK